MDEIKALLDRYMDGATTCAEEQQLRQYFRTHADALPDEWKPLRALFLFVDDEREALELGEALTDSVLEAELPMQTETEQHVAPLVSIRRRARRVWLAVASVAAVLLLVALPFIKGRGHSAYAIIDGQRTNDQEVVMQEAEAALQEVAIDDEDAFGALGEMAL